MRVIVLSLCCGILLAILAIADERPQGAWFSVLDHNVDSGVSLNELSLFDIQADGQKTTHEVPKFQHKEMQQASNKEASK